jgi:outer membrane protein OmpA-like peptidoglycan-associated protein
MKRLRLGAISAAIAAGLAVSYGVLAHDFSALKDGTGNSIRFGAGDCVETSGAAAGAGGCAKAAMADKPAAMADKKEMMADNAATGGAGAAAASTATASSAKAAGGGGSLANVKDGSGNTVNAGAGGCLESAGGSTSGCDAAAKNMAEKPAMADSKASAPAAAAAATTAAAGGATSLGNHQVGEATHGHLADGQKTPVRTGTGGCVNLGYSANSPDHPADCAFQASKPVAAAPAPAPTPAPAPQAAAPAKPVPAAPPTAVPGTVRNTGPIGDAGAGAAAMGDIGTDTSNEFPTCPPRKSRAGALVDDCAAPTEGAMAKAAPAAPPVSVPGTVRNTAPVESGSGMAAESAPAAADAGALQDSPPPPPIPAPPTQVVRGEDRPMDVPAPARQADSAAPAPVAPAPDVPGTVRNTAPAAADSGAPSGNVQMPAAKPAPIPAPEYEKISLSADVLFKFDRYRERDMLPAGRAKLDDVADKINNYIVDTIDHIDLTGHTDRLGSDAYNQRLSERRAKTVKGYLVKKGVDGSKIATKGRGERAPVVQCKGNKATKKLIRCLQPNRRVDVEIHGVKQK